MKFLFLTVALVHCALAASGNGEEKRAPTSFASATEKHALVTDEQFQSEEFEAAAVLEFPHATNPAAAKVQYKAYLEKHGPNGRVYGIDLALENQEEAQGLDSDEADEQILLFATERCTECPTKVDPEHPELGDNMIDDSKTCGKCFTLVEQPSGPAILLNLNNRHVRTGESFETTKKAASISKRLLEDFKHTAQQGKMVDHHNEVCPDNQWDKPQKPTGPAGLAEYNVQAGAKALEYVVNYMNNLDGRVPEAITKPIRNKNILECIPLADRADAIAIEALYTNNGTDGKNKRAVFNVILAANYLFMTDLLHVGCVKIATLIKGETPQKIREILGDDDAEAPAGQELDEATQAEINALADTRRRILEAMSKCL